MELLEYLTLKMPNVSVKHKINKGSIVLSHTLIFHITIAVINTISSVQNINVKMAKQANGACSPTKHSTVPLIYHLCMLYKLLKHFKITKYHTGLFLPLELLNIRQFRIDIEVFTTSAYRSSNRSHSPFHDNHIFVPILNFLKRHPHM